MILSKGLTRLGGAVALAALLLSAGLASMPSAHAQAAAVFYGPAESADSVVVAHVDGVECATAAVGAEAGSSTGYLWFVQIDENQCDATSGSEVSFTVDGEAANETVTWEAGSSPADAAVGITLTVEMMETPAPVETPDTPDTMTPTVPDTGNAGLVTTSSSSPWLALGLGALAVAMLAGARSATGRVR